jgi:hypothetical protein
MWIIPHRTKGGVVMSRMPHFRWAAVCIALFLSFTFIARDISAETDEDRELAEIRKMIEEKGLHWTAGKTSVSGLSAEEKRLRCGYVSPPEWMLDEIPEFIPSGDTIFDVYFDWHLLGFCRGRRL